ncbi:hypothetical protein GCM10009555_017040 [Acrocarpospora macrocephala]|uniref:HTH gntR-type domain-containing protein n=1 Tax=Acrocarpospora macrocephala TaxID=150177 RepID=A0A5M3WEH2_9ACTN|nr:hypothetical protein Amac_009590 [Acrocarpospora macrocephala]
MPEFQRRHDVHLWVQIYDTVRERIEDGTYPAGMSIPSESEMVDEFKAARNTVRKALRHLRDDGWIYTVAQLGSFPAAPSDPMSPPGRPPRQ